MASTQDLLVEIGTEELPPKALDKLSSHFAESIHTQLAQLGLSFADLRRYASPRRLAVLVEGLADSQPSREVERKGPALKAAFDADGKPTKAAEGFARSCGVEVAALETQDTPKGAWLIYREHQAGKPTAELIPAVVEKALADLPIPKRMRWGDRNEEFVRPVHWIVLLFGDHVIAGDVMGIRADRFTRGHRFHHPEAISLGHARDYLGKLENPGKVLADIGQRREAIRQQVQDKAHSNGGKAFIDEALLDEVTALNEWPMAIVGHFDERFLDIPPEVLITTMKEHQKYFPVFDADGGLKPNFITIANIESRDEAQVRAGNERVIRPRFSDAAFFWEQDLKQPLDSKVESLKDVVFQNKLGSIHAKAVRVGALARHIANNLGGDAASAERAAMLCKCDLMSNMVGEFPGLQGTMGRYYAQKAGENSDVSAAMEEHYLPRHAGDMLPRTGIGRALAVADRLDTLVGIFAIGEKPTGEKDPFGLRRAALGVLRILIETPLELDLRELVDKAATQLAHVGAGKETAEEVLEYVLDRVKAYYADKGLAPDVIDAVLAQGPARPADLDRKVRAIAEFKTLPEAESLAAANKRIRNILRKAEEDYPAAANADVMTEDAERKLLAEIEALRPTVDPLLAEGDYTQAMKHLAGLRSAVDRFFDDVMVMDEDPGVRKNRLALLSGLSDLFLQVGDLSRLQ